MRVPALFDGSGVEGRGKLGHASALSGARRISPSLWPRELLLPRDPRDLARHHLLDQFGQMRVEPVAQHRAEHVLDHALERVAALDLGLDDQLRKRCERARSEEHTSELQSLMRISYAVFCLK